MHPDAPSAPPPPRPAFTLVELLVVIAILGILAALLLPVLGRAKNNAGKIVDFNNLKEQTLVLHALTADNNDELPRPNWDDGGAPGVRSLPGWLYTPDLYARGTARFQLDTGLFWSALHDPKLYLCPLDKTNSPLFLKRPQQLSSYAMNGAVVGFGRKQVPAVRLSQMAPTACVFWETDELHPDYFNDGANIPSEGVSSRHSQGAVRAAFDGSVSYIKFADWQALAAAKTRNDLWCYPESDNGR